MRWRIEGKQSLSTAAAAAARGEERMRSMMIGAGATAVLALLATVFSSSPAAAQDFYKGKTLTIVVGFTPGGGFDANARLLSRHIGDHIAGHPEVVVQNMPGAASMQSVNYLDATAPRDGTVITTYNFGLIGDSRMRPDRVKIDFRKFNWIGSIGEDPAACYVSKSLGVSTLAELKSHGQFHMGLTSVGSSSDTDQRILRSIFGVEVQQVAGYPGSAEKRLAIERGEVDGDCGAWSEIPTDWIEGGKIVTLVNLASYRPVGMADSVPFAVDLAQGDHDKAVVRLLISSAEDGRPFIASHDVPADHLKILRDAFDATMKDPAFLADAAKLRLPVNPKNAAEAEKVVEDIYTAPEDVVEAARKVIEQ
jgi:tripartite-type tricarboxylate transporter receptor subunit TctC